jgi:uncharacterized protein YndB with AHSA1/START domain
VPEKKSKRAGPPAESVADRKLVLSRVYDAPRELVWKAMTDPGHVVHGWGPKGFSNTLHKLDLRPGGVWSHTMHGPDGTDYPNRSVFIEIVKPKRLVRTPPCWTARRISLHDRGSRGVR